MRGFYNVLTELQTLLDADDNVNTVTYGDIDDVALNKQTIYPLAHVMVNNCNYQGSILNMQVSVICMDIVDITKETITDVFLGKDNEQDVLNTQLAVLIRLFETLRRNDYDYQLREDVTLEPFTDRFEDKVAGWTATFNIEIENDMTICG